jgi:hypothetical protein
LLSLSARWHGRDARKGKIALEEERQKLHQEQLALDMQRSRSLNLGESDRASGIASTSGLLKLLLG